MNRRDYCRFKKKAILNWYFKKMGQWATAPLVVPFGKCEKNKF